MTEAAGVRRQLELLLVHHSLRTSRRSVSFLRYIVEQTLAGHGDSLKERTIGVDVFGKPLTYDTNLDHAVRTAATELRKRLNLYYADPAHSDELRILLLPGSYVPQFRLAETRAGHPVEAPADPEPAMTTAEAPAVDDAVPVTLPKTPTALQVSAKWGARTALLSGALTLAAAAVCILVWFLLPKATPRQQFWQPLQRAPGPVLIATGGAMHGPPSPAVGDDLSPVIAPAVSSTPNVPFSDAVAVARVAAVFGAAGKETVIRREDASSFADLREHPAVLIGAFNNEWSLRLMRNLRFSLALDPTTRTIYIRDREQPASRAWGWNIDPHPAERDRNSTVPLHDYALITRILGSETGHEVVMIGGLYTYGTQAAAEFVADPQLLSLTRNIPLGSEHRVLQIVLEAQVTDRTAGPARVVAYSVE